MTAMAARPETGVLMVPCRKASTRSLVCEESSVQSTLKAYDGVELGNIEVDQTSNNPETLKRGVSFHKIEIREYERCLGDNPATTHGPPLSLTWQYNVVGTFDVEEYEQYRPTRRVSQQLMVPGHTREKILLDHTDVTKTQINACIAQIKVLRHRRQMSIAMQEIEDYIWLGEAIVRRLRRLRSGVSKKREQQLLWENAQHVMASKAAKQALNDCGSDDGSTHDTERDTRPSDSSCSSKNPSPVKE